MTETITRVVKLVCSASTPENVLSMLTTDNGFSCRTVEKADLNNKPNISCIPRKRRFPGRYRYSEKHGFYLYHIDDVPGRTGCEIHAANVAEQLLGCLAVGAKVIEFKAGSIHPGMPSHDCLGVTSSAATLTAFHAAMKNPVTGAQDPFWLDIC